MRNTVHTKLLFDLDKPGIVNPIYPPCDVPEVGLDDCIPPSLRASSPPPIPSVPEPDVVRHFTNLSTLNMSVDTHFYPLGSCTMKYNPKRNERLASLDGFINLHPLQPAKTIPGLLELLYELAEGLGEIAGLPAVSLQPAAGAHGELTALLVAAAYFRDKGMKRTKVLIPDSAHGTNPASAAIAGFHCVTVKSKPNGAVDLDDFHAKLDDQVAVLMITNPSTVGLFEQNIRKIADAVHAKGGLIYLDGANMNAILGIARPGDFGADMMHYNLHKTFSGPHGGGGPGAGPIAVRDFLAPYLPSPVIEKVGDEYVLQTDRPKSIGRVRSFFGSVGVLLRAYAYMRTHGPEGLKSVSENAVLNANYLLAKLAPYFPMRQGNRCMHEFVASAEKVKAEKGITAMDVAKRLLDHGFHAPTVYFPLIVPEALMMEPTETESKETLDAFVAAIESILKEDAEKLRAAPYTAAISRPDDVRAARAPQLAWKS